jgi:hypothetical protein
MSGKRDGDGLQKALETEIPVGTFLNDVFAFKDNFHGNDDATI